MVILIMFRFNKILRRSIFKPVQRMRLFFTALLIVTGWFVLISILSIAGVFSDFSSLPPRPPFLILLPLPFVLWFSFTKTFRRLAIVTPNQWLINIQTFRVVVEIILWLMLLAGQLPVQMTFEGRNWDILAGLTAIPFSYWCFGKGRNNRKLAITWNIGGLILLLNILIIAVLSMPTPIRYFMNEPSNTIVGEFPYTLLPGILVVIAYTMHIFSLRQLSISR
jgi:hypothetical protein